MEGWVDLRGWLYVEMVLCQQSPIQVATWQPLDRESIPRLLVQRTIRPPKYVSRLTVVWRFIELSTVDSLTCAVSTQDAVLARSQNLSRTLYQTESLELLRLNYHYLNATFLDLSALLLQLRSGHCQLLSSYKAHLTAGMTNVCLDCGVAPHSVEHLFQCPACRHNSQLKICGWPRRGGSMTTDERRGALGYNNNQLSQTTSFNFVQIHKHCLLLIANISVV